MKREKIEELRESVECPVILERAGFALDAKESTRRALKYRRGAEIIIVTHGGRGWFDPLSDDKGDVISLMARLDCVEFLEAVRQVALLVGAEIIDYRWEGRRQSQIDPAPIAERWQTRRKPWPGSAGWSYLRFTRAIPANVIRAATKDGSLREGPYGSMWAAHMDDTGTVCGWEERGPDWRGFSTGGAKILFRLRSHNALRLCVTEAAIDAMSLAALEGLRDETLYLSTGGGWSPMTDAALRRLSTRPGVQIVAATDANSQGDVYADRLRQLSDEVGCDFMRLRPSMDDWNEVLKQKQREKEEPRK